MNFLIHYCCSFHLFWVKVERFSEMLSWHILRWIRRMWSTLKELYIVLICSKSKEKNKRYKLEWCFTVDLHVFIFYIYIYIYIYVCFLGYEFFIFYFII